jgi:uncharacterized protein (DUF2267 family)
MTRPAVFSSTVQEADIWLKTLCEEMRTDNANTAYAALRGVLHELRDRLTIDEAAHLSAQLPMLIRGLFYEGWKPSVTPTKVRTVREFLDGVRDKAPGHDELDPNRATQCVFQLLSSRIAPGEINQVIQMLPKELRTLWPARQQGDNLGQAAAAMGNIERGVAEVADPAQGEEREAQPTAQKAESRES